MIFLITLVLGSNSAIPFGVKIAILIVYLVAFYSALWHRDWKLLLASFVGFILIAILGIYEDVYMLIFGFTFADLLGRAKAKWQIACGMLGIAGMFLTVMWLETGSLLHIESQLLIPMMMIQLVFPILIYFVEKSKNLQSELAEVNTQLVQQEERQRIARDLHDTIGHTLMMIKVKTELTTKLIDRDPTSVKQELNDILSTTRTALKQVRELVSDMNFISLQTELVHCQQLLRSANITTTLSNHYPNTVLSSVEETMLALCVREATTNILKHSKAKNCRITIQCQNGQYTLAIKDDGIGLQNKGFGNGINSMQERMHVLQGYALFEGDTTTGTSVLFSIPIQNGKEPPT
ncbi:sensor histidine kinase [Lysinibacillus macroides]|uniref:sensor histidine kinase n=1 Tax=Lysinibacillus macroides TaxID=33935 RepID=UPI001F44D0EB|nr:sensor histidine kinase [Lysinibacillus macroides]